MAAVGAVVDAVFGSYDLKVAKQWHDEDVEYREQEKQWREDAVMREIAWRNADLERERRMLKLENEKRIIDARQTQLAALSQISALLAGFSMVSLVEINLPPDLNRTLLLFYGSVCCIVFIFMLLCMLECTLLLLAVTRFVTHTLDAQVRHLTLVELDLVSPFCAWWLQRCESEWLLAYRFFRFGVSFFFAEVSLIGWAQFGRSLITCIAVTVLCVGGLVIYYLRVASRWRYLVKYPASELPTATRTTTTATPTAPSSME